MAAPGLMPFRNSHPRFLDGLSLAETKVIVAAAKQERYLPNSVIASQGDCANHLFMLVSGRARCFYLTSEGKKVILRWLTPGQICGQAAILSTPSEYLIGTEAVKNSSVLVWGRATIRGFAARYPQLNDNTMLIMFDYLTLYRDTHIAMTYDAADQRVAHVLTNLANTIGKRIALGIEVDVRNEELANEANVTLFTVSRLISTWRRQGILTKSRGKVLLRSPEELLQRI